MALIRCSECGQTVSDKARACPHCGAPVERKLLCDECGKEIPIGASFCPACGCPVGSGGESNQSPVEETYQATDAEGYICDFDSEEDAYRKKQIIVWTIVGLAVVAVVAFYLFAETDLFTREEASEEVVSVDTTEVVMETVEAVDSTVPIDEVMTTDDEDMTQWGADGDPDGYYDNSYQDEQHVASSASSSQSSNRTDPATQRLEREIQGDIDDLYDMARTGQLNPMNVLYMKQNTPNQIRELIERYRQEGNSAKVNEWTYKLSAIESVLDQIRI